VQVDCGWRRTPAAASRQLNAGTRLQVPQRAGAWAAMLPQCARFYRK
jgi:hypothetical protein